MKAGDLLRIALLNLWRRKLRAFLTVLGMVIGTSSIVVMVSLGIGIRQATVESYASYGSLTNISVNSWRWVDNGDGSGTSTEKKLNKKSVEAFKKIPGVKVVMPVITTWGMLKSGKYVSDASIMGIDAALAEEFGIELGEGRYPGYKRGSSNYEIALSQDTLNWFRDPKTGKEARDKDGNPKVTLGSRFQLTFDYNSIYNNQPARVNEGFPTDDEPPQGQLYRVSAVGMTEPNTGDFSWYCLMDIDALKKLAAENKAFVSLDTDNYQSVIVKCENTDVVAQVKAAIDEMGFGTNSLQDMLEQAEKQLQQIQLLLGAIGGVSLLVAAIGIMNTMMMSIYERTREIGIIKVLGCRMHNIAGLFLCEAAYIGLFGGALGILVSYGLSLVINLFIGSSGFKSVIPPYLVLGALAFSVMVALFSGLYPALRAMRLSPLTAIRSE
ncbi:MAG: ABC transporter permease [Christensenellaceae bacterium]|jgi:ABC-type antimicrobial peptide transport system permease subunit|nr:ABC transporter permease [Christensenellaceae bacterium]